MGIFKLKDEILPDYIFLDLNMPLIEGKEAISEIRKIPRLSSVPLVMYTSSANISDISETKTLGADFYFVKPQSSDFLQNKLDQLFNNELETYLIKQF